MQSLGNRMKIRELLVFPELREICMREAKFFESPNLIKEVIVDPKSKSGASYSSRDHLVKFNMDLLTTEAIEWADKLIKEHGLLKKNRELYANTLMLVALYHELRHAHVDYKFAIRDMSSIEFYLMFMSRMVVNYRTDEFYTEHYLSIPCERDAEMTAWVKVLKLIEGLNLKPKELFELQRTFITLSIAGYEFSEEATGKGYFPGPFDSMLERYYNDDYLTNKDLLMSSLHDYSTYDRTRLGLPIYIDEMKKYGNILASGNPVDIEKDIVKSL